MALKGLPIPLFLFNFAFQLFNLHSLVAAGRYISTYEGSIAFEEALQTFEWTGMEMKATFNINGFQGFIFDSNEVNVDKFNTLRNVSFNVFSDGKVSSSLGNYQPLWGLDRINQRDLPLDENIDFGTVTGEGINVYILDSGIETSHPEFEGRAQWGINFAEDNQDEDCQGHGTHVAGIIMSKSFGVAKRASAISVKTLSCDGTGSWSSFIQGVEWVVHHAAGTGKRSILNMSLGGERFEPANRAVAAAVDAGILVVAAAGNENDDACNYSPGSEPKAVTVAASDKRDDNAHFSNYGTCVDLIAPGTHILSTYLHNSTRIMSGTSMASPLAAGVMALLYQTWNSSFSIAGHLLNSSTKDKIVGFPNDPPTKNHLLFYSNSV